MTRLLLLVEGQTEQVFVRDVLARHLGALGVFAPLPRCVETGRRRGRIFRGGMTSFARARGDLLRWMREDSRPDVRFSTMFDLYRLPTGFPGLAEARRLPDPLRRAQCLEEALADEIRDRRFIPYVQLHEFEALLLADPEEFSVRYPDKRGEVGKLVELAREFSSPEHIDDGEESAPSKRIGALLPRYLREKPTAGPLVAGHIGLPVIRAKCAHFNEWLTRLEGLAGAGGREGAAS